MTQSLERIILETGIGTDLYGENYTKAAIRAVDDAIHHSSLTLFSSLELDSADMQVRVTIGVQDPEHVNAEAVAATLPRGKATVKVLHGGQNIVDPKTGTTSVIATAAIEAYYPIDKSAWKLSAKS